MEQLLDGLFRVLDPRAVLAIILLRFELLQEAEARRSCRVPGSAVLGHAETLLAAVRHLITNANGAAHFLPPGCRHRAKLHGGERIALIIKRREASKAASGDQACGKFLHSRDVLRTATEPMTAKEIASGRASCDDFNLRPLRLPPSNPGARTRCEQPVRTVCLCFRLHFEPRNW